MERVLPEQVSFHPHSFADPDGRLFWWEGNLYRAISHQKAPFFKQLLRNETVQRLIRRGLLIDSQPVDWVLDGYGMVLRHHRVPFVSYPEEWCAAMLKDAASAYLDLVGELIPAGLTLKDTHPWNLLFEGAKPVYVDLTSIKPIIEPARYFAQDKFRRYYLYPLLLMSQGQERIARRLLPDYEGIPDSLVALLVGKAVRPFSLSSILARLAPARDRYAPASWREWLQSGFITVDPRRSDRRQRSPREVLERMRRELEGIPLPLCQDIQSPSAADDFLAPYGAHGTLVQETLDGVISELGPGSILAAGARSVTCRGVMERQEKPIVFLDRDSTLVTRLYCTARAEGLPLLPLVMDLSDPTPSRGLSGHLSVAAQERLKCDMVIALALVNRLMAERHLRLEQIVEGMARFSKRWLIVDLFSPAPGDRNWDRYSGCSPEPLFHALEKEFRQLKLLSCGLPGYRLVLCEK